MPNFVRIDQVIVQEQPVLRNTGLAADVLTQFGLSNSVQEELWVVTMDGARHVRNVYAVAKGGYHDCDISLPTVLSPVFLSATDRFLVAHNHPSGELEPTTHDMELTWRISAAADQLDLMFEDHLIVAPSGEWYSFRGNKLLRPKSTKVSSR